MRLGQLVVVLLDEWLGALVRSIPGLTGCVLRYAYFRMTFAKLEGFCFVASGARLTHSYGMRVGRNFHLNSGAFIDARGGLTLGNDVLIGPNSVLVTSNHQWTDPSLPIVVQGHVVDPVTVGDDVWIGASAVILPGVTLGTGTVVAAGAVVTRSTEPYTIVGGIPAEVIGTRPGPPAAQGSQTA